jgi:uncharacterized membrane protein YgcG
MPALLLKLIPFRDYAYAAIFAALVVWYNAHVHNLEVAYATRQETSITAAVAATTAKDQKAAAALVASLNKQHDEDVAKVQANYEDQIKRNLADHDADLSRLRILTTKNSGGGNSNPVLGSASSSAATGGGGDTGAGGLGSVPGALGLTLVDALRADDSALSKCYADRDSLTGK